jgi:hypothetical protein
MTPTKPRKGGARFSSTESRIAKVIRVRRIMDLGYNSDTACKRAGTSLVNVRKWAKELGIKFNY